MILYIQKRKALYLPISKGFISDYIYHSLKLKVPCGIIFGIENTLFNNDYYFIKNLLKVKRSDYVIKNFDNIHGSEPSFWFNMKKLIHYNKEQ